MFIKETTETTNYTRKSKFGKLVSYSRTKKISHWQCDQCNVTFTKVGLPPKIMSTPRPAIFVAIVTAPFFPA